MCWFEIYVDDIERAKKFYETVLDVQLTRVDTPDTENNQPKAEMWAFPMNEGSGAPGALCKMDGAPVGGNSTLVYFNCVDCSIESSRIETAGGKLLSPKMSIGEYGFIAIAQDTEGNTIGFHSSE